MHRISIYKYIFFGYMIVLQDNEDQYKNWELTSRLGLGLGQGLGLRLGLGLGLGLGS